MIDLPFPVTIAVYAVSAAVLLHQIVYSVKRPPHGTDPNFWARSVRFWRHRRAKRQGIA